MRQAPQALPFNHPLFTHEDRVITTSVSRIPFDWAEFCTRLSLQDCINPIKKGQVLMLRPCLDQVLTVLSMEQLCDIYEPEKDIPGSVPGFRHDQCIVE
ncbi:hypothetical protein VNO77_27972 [Canavalia gladiata]|uniref:Uncharacterized protein n=1 Tax=Canavalia gladiata TaxID=3824 RepID=A0AAN9KWA6_CANGL